MELDMNSTAPQNAKDKSRRIPDVPALLLFLFAIGVPSATALAFVKTITQNPWQWLALGLLYECCIGILGFMGKVWQRLEGSLIDLVVSWIRMHASLLTSRSWRRYRTFLIHEHEVFDIKGLTTHPGRDLELEQVFVQLDVDPTPVHHVSVNPIPMPEALREGSHHIWSYLADKTLLSRHFVIVGAPGSGKTTLLKHLALCLARHRKAGVQRIPVFLYLRDH